MIMMMMTVKWVLKKYGVRVWAVSNSLREQNVDGVRQNPDESTDSERGGGFFDELRGYQLLKVVSL
jgi:hypothetical protein